MFSNLDHSSSNGVVKKLKIKQSKQKRSGNRGNQSHLFNLQADTMFDHSNLELDHPHARISESVHYSPERSAFEDEGIDSGDKKRKSRERREAQAAAYHQLRDQAKSSSSNRKNKNSGKKRSDPPKQLKVKMPRLVESFG